MDGSEATSGDYEGPRVPILYTGVMGVLAWAVLMVLVLR